jgi:N-acetylglucosaminyl-diphospho-decaprenol L-rhamnosyltransferase
MDLLSQLTVVILTYKTNNQILLNCLNSIDKNVKIRIIENSSEFNKEEELLKKFPNLSIVYTNNNLGFGGGNNFGFKSINTKFVLALSPDTICDNNFFQNIKLYLKSEIEFSIIGVTYSDQSIHSSFGYFTKRTTIQHRENSLIDVDWVIGCAMLIDLNKFKEKKVFDENFFIYFDEFDACFNTIKDGGKVFSSKILLLKHLGGKGSLAADLNYKEATDKFRDWHWMWSQFYFYKKNYSFVYALKKTLSKLIRFFIGIIFYKILGNKYQYNKSKYKFLGLYNSITGNDSIFRLED